MKIINLFILDKSPSMGTIKGVTISGFNEQLEAIKGLDKANNVESLFGLITFDTTVEIKYLNQSINVAEKLTTSSYRPENGSGTAFYDALGVSIKALEDALGGELGEAKVLITILTDGEENSSHLYTGSQVADLIKQYQADYGWTFTFIGANIDVEKLATSLNVDRSNTLNFIASAVGTEDAYATLNLSRSAYYTKSVQGEDTTTSFFATDQQK